MGILLLLLLLAGASNASAASTSAAPKGHVRERRELIATFKDALSAKGGADDIVHELKDAAADSDSDVKVSKPIITNRQVAIFMDGTFEKPLTPAEAKKGCDAIAKLNTHIRHVSYRVV